MGLPKGYGKANNPEGKGLEKRWLSKYAATETLSKIIIDVLMEKPTGVTRAEQIVRKQAFLAAAGDRGAAEFLFDRTLGKPVATVVHAGDPENPLNVAHSGEVAVSATDALIEAIIGFGEDSASTQSRPN